MTTLPPGGRCLNRIANHIQQHLFRLALPQNHIRWIELLVTGGFDFFDHHPHVALPGERLRQHKNIVDGSTKNELPRRLLAGAVELIHLMRHRTDAFDLSVDQFQQFVVFVV